ncbi:tRNA-binding protein [Wenyingzhuangia sp. IMCC45533]
MIKWNDFAKIDMRIGTVLSAEVFKGAINPSYLMKIDFGELGVKKTSAQITDLYQPTELIGKQVVAVVNFPPKQIAHIMSECLVLGSLDGKEVTLLSSDKNVKNGAKIA